MTCERYQLLQELFLEARNLPLQQREAFLAAVAERDPELRPELERLLAHEHGSSGRGELLASGGGARLLADALAGADTHGVGDAPPFPLAPVLPARIGRYTLIRQIGQGGMGVVYEAEQDDPRRRVAIKVIRTGLDSPQIVERFHREAQMLGRLRHRGIAQIFDADTTNASGAPPYLVMELVDGLPLPTFAEVNQLDTRGRLELMAEVCDALEHAHCNGLVHRDLKPGNILVEPLGSSGDSSTPADDVVAPRLRGQPKILDFGVARSTDLNTITGAGGGGLIGTIPYMSPEQATGGAIDARSDVYAVGVIAFELLAGRLPYDLKNKMIHEAARIIRDEEPLRLGTLDGRLRGDVDVIVAKAIEKDPDRRYATAAELAADLRRHLGDQPIMARRPSLAYRACKLIRRRRPLLVGGGVAVVGAAMLIFGALSLSQARRASSAVDADKGRGEGGLHAPSPVTEFRRAEDWLAANPQAEMCVFDSYYAGVQPLGGCLAGDGAPVMLPLAGGIVTVSAHDHASNLICAIVDKSSRARVSDAPIVEDGKLVLRFDPPITAFYGMFGSLGLGDRVAQKLYHRDAEVGLVTSERSADEVAASGYGFSSTSPVDRIEFTTSDEGCMLGAFRFVSVNESNLGTVTIPGYGGQYGDTVYIDFACVFVRD